MNVDKWIWCGYGIVDMVFSRVVMSVNGYGAVIGCVFFFSGWLMLVCRDCACEELRGEVWLEKKLDR